MIHKLLKCSVAALALVALFAAPAKANFVTAANATADCRGFALSLTESILTPGDTYTVTYDFLLTCDGSSTHKTATFTFVATDTSATQNLSGTWDSGSLSKNCVVTGVATLNDESSLPITINGGSSASLPCATPPPPPNLTGANATADCRGYTATVNATNLIPGTMYQINLDFALTCNGGSSTQLATITFTADSTGNATETQSGAWNSGALSTNCTVTGTATLTSSSSTVAITVNGQSSASLMCATTGGSKSFGIGPSSMEGDLHISPGDWISGGYNFKFVSGSHAATALTVMATITVPIGCPNGTTENVVIPLGIPGQLDGGGATAVTYNIAAGDTANHASNDQNSNLVWEGAVRAPANLCGGVDGRNQTGAVFNATVTQNPQVGLINWQFHYRDPAAKNAPNTDCTDINDPNRAKAAVCGASWSQTLRDP